MAQDQAKAQRTGWLWQAIAYLVAVIVGGGVWMWGGHLELIPRLWWADVAGTIVIFLFSISLKNSSMYDPYWSLWPMGAAILLFSMSEMGLREMVVLALTCAYGMRLTWNFLRGWPGMSHQDWRYDRLHAKTGKWYWIVSFLGIHMMPTGMTFGGSLSLIPAMYEPMAGWSLFDVLAVMVTGGAVLLEGIADNQLRAFMKSNPPKGSIMESGVWAWCRHPNYLGEILFWWGLWMFGYAANPAYAWTVVGPLAITCLFAFISIPMMDRRHRDRRPGYADHMKQLPGLIPLGLFKRKKSASRTNK
ncbi:DUF1295 domain-containing protein [Pontibacter sp. G13]|uniref:DUF1295 domain-containing protein n=1 Tax=Pontibacter sp. G13 TaxID=3074898 RepID=UPI00288A9435|nr:DUF1295 domain-containing protein [Pontibacter sp. G13]WNJ18588.1 DUF1295 domain-containing protein [Pontibacter sp. G13]